MATSARRRISGALRSRREANRAPAIAPSPTPTAPVSAATAPPPSRRALARGKGPTGIWSIVPAAAAIYARGLGIRRPSGEQRLLEADGVGIVRVPAVARDAPVAGRAVQGDGRRLQAAGLEPQRAVAIARGDLLERGQDAPPVALSAMGGIRPHPLDLADARGPAPQRSPRDRLRARRGEEEGAGRRAE